MKIAAAMQGEAKQELLVAAWSPRMCGGRGRMLLFSEAEAELELLDADLR